MSTDPDATMAFPVAEAPEPARYGTFGEMLAVTMPGFDILPCLRCGTTFAGYEASLLHQDRVLRPLMRLAREAAWGADVWGVWCCPSCLAAPVEEEPDRTPMLEALHQHAQILREFDHNAKATLALLDGEFDPSSWVYDEYARDAAADRWAA